MGLWETSKNVLEAIKKVATVEVQQQVIDLQAGILEMQERLSTLQQENQDLLEKLTIAGTLDYKDGCYRRTSGSDQGPFCSRCWDAEKKLIHLTKTHDPNSMACNNCNHSVNLSL